MFEQSINEAPSVMTVISAEEIKQLGARTLAELLYYVTGMDITRYGRFMTTEYDLRAGGGFDRILWMIDGHLIDYIGPIEIGLAGIKQIEIIRGPGSALFGNSAFTGTVNIITKSPEELDGIKVEAGGGSYDADKASAVAGKMLTGDVGVKFLFDQYETKGPETYFPLDAARGYWDPVFGLHTAKTPLTRREGEKMQVFDARLNYSDTYLWWRWHDTWEELYKVNEYMSINPPTYSNSGNRFEIGTVRDEILLGRVHAKAWYSEVRQETQMRLYPEGFDLREVFGIPELYFPDGGRYIENSTSEISGAELRYDTNFFEKHKVLVGFNYQRHKYGDYEAYSQLDMVSGLPWSDNPYALRDVSALLNPASRELYGLFAEYVYPILDNVHLTLGLRHDDFSDFGESLNPRIGIVWNLSDATFLKLLYGSAYQAPTLGTIASDDLKDWRALHGAPELGAENIDTYEINFGTILLSDLKVDASLFHSRLTDLIRLGPERTSAGSEGTPMVHSFYENIGTIENNGSELELGYPLNENLLLHLTYAYIHSQDLSLDRRNPLVPEHKIHGGWKWDFFHGKVFWVLDVFHSSQRSRPVSDRPPHPSSDPDQVEAYTLVNTNIIVKNVLENIFQGSVDLSFSIHNLLDEKYTIYDALAHQAPDIERPGISFFTALTAAF
ncbi:MAG: TonB-dependent receptor [Deltaproteobacteria bacterium]|nr:TonB-dependent receptor [Deltaproteobacteria bacterium]